MPVNNAIHAKECCYVSKYCYTNVPDQLYVKNAHMVIRLRVKCFVVSVASLLRND